MGAVDPKDMTASELMRVAAKRVEMKGNSMDAIECLRMTVGVDEEITYSKDLAKTLSVLADKIDAELAEARNESLLQGAQVWAKANGWPDFKPGEDFDAWLDRCALKLPCDKDGEPWLIGDRVIAGWHGETTVTGYSFNGLEMFLRLRKHGIDNTAAFSAQYCERPAPEVLGADGKPIKEGETVWDVYGRGPAEVYRIGPADDEDGPVVWDIEGNYTMPNLLTHEQPVLGADDLRLLEGETVYDIETGEAYIVRLPCAGTGKTFFEDGGYRDPAYLTHTPPDTQERIDEEAALPAREYYVRHIGRDVAEKSAVEVHAAVTAHLLKRQRELDAKGGER